MFEIFKKPIKYDIHGNVFVLNEDKKMYMKLFLFRFFDIYDLE